MNGPTSLSSVLTRPIASAGNPSLRFLLADLFAYFLYHPWDIWSGIIHRVLATFCASTSYFRSLLTFYIGYTHASNEQGVYIYYLSLFYPEPLSLVLGLMVVFVFVLVGPRVLTGLLGSNRSARVRVLEFYDKLPTHLAKIFKIV